MTRTLTILFLLTGYNLIGYHAGAQCREAATLRTSKDFCLGSSLTVSDPHTMERIVWYKDGQPIDSVSADQSLATTPVKITMPGCFLTNGALTVDEAGNVYTYDEYGYRVIKWSPLGGVTTVGPLPDAQEMHLFVDHAGNVYASEAQTEQAVKFTPGSQNGIVVATVPQVANLGGTLETGLYVDCQGAVYIGDAASGAVYKWPAGDTSGTVIIGTNGPGNVGNLLVDSNGNVFVLSSTSVQNSLSVQKWAPGTNSGVTVASFGPSFPIFPEGLWMDGSDTLYLVGPDNTRSSIEVLKWGPGAAGPTLVCSFPASEYGIPAVTMDTKGNIYVVGQVGNQVYEFLRTSIIDSVFTPTATGQYYAVVTDMQGYAATTNKIVINSPTAGPPSIRISATATSTPVCTPITFTANTTNAGIDPVYQWEVSGVPAGADSTTYSYNLFANGDQVYCILTAQAGCTGPLTATSNILTLSIDPHGTASLTIATPKDTICQGDTAAFTATVTNGSNTPAFEWLLNGAPTGGDSATYIRGNFSNGDVITCLLTSDDVCGLAKSNSIPLTVSTPPTIESGQVFTILHGHTATLNPVTTGDISSYQWTPPTGLSDPSIADPVASPDANTLYTLTVTAPGSCMASAGILVNVYTPISLPGAFTPNGDGHNDLYYVLGGPMNSRVEEFDVFNRYGAEVFHVHGAAPGDPSAAWNGTLHGTPAPAGTYVYMVVMAFADGSRQVYKGTVLLIR